MLSRYRIRALGEINRVKENDRFTPINTIKDSIFSLPILLLKTRECAAYREQEITTKIEKIPANYGLTGEEKQVIINAFIVLKKGLMRCPRLPVQAKSWTLQICVRCALLTRLPSKKIMSIKGRGKVYTKSFLRWLLQDLKRSTKRTQYSAKPIKIALS